MGTTMGIKRSSIEKRRRTGGRSHHWRKLRKHEIGRPSSNTKLSNHNFVKPIRTRGGNIKFRGLRLCNGNFSWKSRSVTFKSRILGVVYNATNNELVRTNTLVKGAIVALDAIFFLDYLRKKKQTKDVTSSNRIATTHQSRFPTDELDRRLHSQLENGKLLAIISSRPGQCGRVAGHILEGSELDFYYKKLSRKNK